MPIKKSDLDAKYDLDFRKDVEKVVPLIDGILKTKYKPGLKVIITEKDLEYQLSFIYDGLRFCLKDLYPDWHIELISRDFELVLVFS